MNKEQNHKSTATAIAVIVALLIFLCVFPFGTFAVMWLTFIAVSFLSK